MNVDWGAIRREFPVTERCIYLNTGWSGPQSRSVVSALEQRAEREAFDGPTTIDVRHEKALLVQAARRAFASTIGADEDEVALGYTTTEGVNTVLRGLGLGSGDEVITCNLEHNSVMVPSYMSRTIARAITIPAAPPSPWTNRSPTSTPIDGATTHSPEATT